MMTSKTSKTSESGTDPMHHSSIGLWAVGADTRRSPSSCGCMPFMTLTWQQNIFQSVDEHKMNWFSNNTSTTLRTSLMHGPNCATSELLIDECPLLRRSRVLRSLWGLTFIIQDARVYNRVHDCCIISNSSHVWIRLASSECFIFPYFRSVPKFRGRSERTEALICFLVS